MQTNDLMRTTRKSATITGVLYITAAVAAIIAGILYQPILSDSSIDINTAGHRAILGAIVDLFTVCSVAGTAIMLFPYIRSYNAHLGLAYLCFRWFEAITILLGLIAVLATVSLHQAYPTNSEPIMPIVVMLRTIHSWTMIVGPNFLLGINTLIYSLVFYRTQLIPRMLAALGMFGAATIFLAAILEVFQFMEQFSATGAVLALPVFAFEMTLAIRLLVKGFNEKSAILKPRNFCEEELFGIGA